MKHFVILINYTAPADVVDSIRSEHREFLKGGYQKGILLMSGPFTPPTGGAVVARAESEDDIRAFFSKDPYAIQSAATHQIIEFDPVLRQSFLEEWVR